MVKEFEKIKVLAVVPSPYVYGLQNITLRYFQLATNIQSHFLLTHWSDGEFAQRLDDLKIPYTSSWLGMFSRKLDWYNLRMTLHCLSKMPILYYDYVNLIRSYKPDLIYTANHHEILLLWPLLFFFDIPVVCHMHDPTPSSTFYRFTARIYSRVVDQYIAISQSVYSRMRSLGIDANKISIVYNGIDISHFKFVSRRSCKFTDEAGWPQDSILVGITGQMHQDKGHQDLLSAIKAICYTYPNVRLVIGGKETGAYADELRQQIKEADLATHVYFAGWQADVKDFFQGIDIFVLPSRHEEGFGLVVAEAMATGLPVIVARSGGATELIEDGVSGILVDKKTPVQLEQALIQLVTDASLRTRMGVCGHSRVKSIFDIYSQVQMFQDVLRNSVNPYAA